ncbi:MAG TPA: biotin/lipoyl-containing protein [Longimicrobiales bacterium]|nr:biotin/lipoyl-containing protein [Longimicrobiales bacterium]
MRYYVTIKNRTYEVDLADAPRIDGERVDAELVAVPGTPVRHLLADGRSMTVVARRGERGEWELHLAGARFDAAVVDERTRAIRAMTGKAGEAAGPRPVRAPMPGLVVGLLVEEGQAVAAGDGVAIVEAMKMENELKAEAPGVVSRIVVETGQAVNKGDVLVEFDATEDDGAREE